MKTGNYEIIFLSDGTFLLDGGAMFGVVPKVLWERKTPADKKNRITLGLNSLLLIKRNEVILIESGFGEIEDRKFQDIYEVKRKKTLIDSILEKGISLEDIKYVINTHLHFDHCGWNTIKGEKGFKPTFPKAKYVIQRMEWESALNPDERSMKSYWKERLTPVQKYGNLELIDGDTKIYEDLKLIHLPGHTKGHQCVLIEGKDEKILFAGDLIPTSAHFPLSYIMAYDLFPLETLNNKKKILEKAHREKWLFALYHDPKYVIGRTELKEEKWSFVPMEGKNGIIS